MIEGVKVIRTINKKAIEFSYKGVVFGMLKEDFDKMTIQELEKSVQKVNERREKIKLFKERESEKCKEMLSKEKKDYNMAKSVLFERWNEYDDE